MQKLRTRRSTTANRASKRTNRYGEHACVVLMQVLLTVNLLLGTVLLFCSGEKNIVLITAVWVVGMVALLVTELLDRQ